MRSYTKRSLRRKPRLPARSALAQEAAANGLRAYQRAFVEWTQSAGLSEETAKLRSFALDHFIVWCDTRGQGERVQKTVGGTTTLFAYDESGNLIGEYDSSGNPIEETVRLADIPIAVLKPTGTYYVHTDQLNTPRQINDQSGNAVWAWNIATFGASTPNQDPTNSGTQFSYNPRFPGQYFDSETGLYYNYYRDYDPRTGRYVESDPIGLQGGLNTYGYVEGNPISYFDPTGLVGIYTKDGITFDVKPGVGGGQTEHARAGAGEQFHFQLKKGGQVGPRIGTDTFAPLTPEDEKLFKGEFKDICKRLTPAEKSMLKRSTRDVFFGDIVKAQRRLGRFKLGALGALMSNSYDETCDKDVLGQLDEVCN